MTEESTRETIIRTRFVADPYIASQGFILEEVHDDGVSVAAIVRPDQTNFQGSTHGGVIFSLADCAFSLAGNAYSESAVAIDTHMVYTAPSKVGDRLVATATEMTRGRTLCSYRVIITRPDGRTVGLFTGTALVLD